MKVRFLLVGLVCLFATVACISCGGATRATVHDEDLKKVFPWPRSKQEVTIRAKPQTTMANTCFLFGSFEEVVVTPDTTFYITDELDKQFAYTPSRSPIRRLAPANSIEIRWPIKKPEAPQPEKADPAKEESGDKQEESVDEKEKQAPPEQP